MDRHDEALTIGSTLTLLAEILGWVAFWRFGWHLGESPIMQWLMALGFLAVSVTVWGAFRARGWRPGGRGHAVITVPGPVRLFIEYAFFLLSILVFRATNWSIAAYIQAIVVVLITVTTLPRLRILLNDTTPRKVGSS